MKGSQVRIYKDLVAMKYGTAGSSYADHVYYISKQAVVNGTTYYQLSRKPNSGVVGWVKSSDLTTHAYKTISTTKQTLYLKGTGWAYTEPWGGNVDAIFKSLSKYKGQAIEIGLTMDVGNNTWYRGVIAGKTIYIHKNNVTEKVTSVLYSKYNITLSQALNMQMNIKSTPPQTDQKYAYVSKEYVENGKITANALNVRKGPGTSFAKVGTLYSGNQVQIVKDLGEWVAIVFPHNIWVNAIESDVLYYLNPNNFVNDSRQVFQFLDLSKPSGASASQLNAYLKGKGDLDNLGKAFIDAANKYGVNDIYLLSHALLETGNGKYAKFEYNNKTVYNMFGIGAVDSNAYEGAAERAYREGWTTPEKAIIGGAAFIGNNYVKAGQNTLYKMRWNPSAMDTYKYATHQYATDIAWAYKQINTMYRLYQDIGVYYLNLEIPVYK
ncbi:N-acetylglucosaminidase [Bacillus andreraoultii]|nr:glucosaminidase domain-containing protein [Bacillus andreraoultii]